MTEPANFAQHEAWNGDGGRRWVATADQRDQVLAPVADSLLAAVAPSQGQAILDLGCGCGATTLRAGRSVGATGSAIGIDLSGPMLSVARTRAGDTANVRFVQADAQTHEFAPASIDVTMSRFGSMFFDDPVRAFANVGVAMRPGAQLSLATWRPLDANEWLVLPGAALLPHAVLPAEAVDGPGMFAQSDPRVVMTTLEAAGYVDVAMDPVDVTFTLGRTVDEAVDYLADSGPGRVLLDTIPIGAARDAAIDDVRAALSDHMNDTGVHLGGAIWIITAHR